MIFVYHLWNHTKSGKRSLEDVISIVGNMQRQLGHTVVWDTENDAKVEAGEPAQFIHPSLGYNVIVEGFTHTIIDAIKTPYEGGARFICLATEEPTDKGFNHGTQKEMVLRQQIFPEAMKYFDAILHLVPGKHITDWYGQFCPAAYAELGFAPQMVRPIYNQNPEYDFAFFGSLTDRRLKLLRKLSQYVGSEKAVRVVADFATGQDRDLAVQNAKVVIQVRKFEALGLVSSSRCCTALYNGRPVVAEPHDKALSKPWDEIVKFTDTEQAFLLNARLARQNWRQMHGEQFVRFMTRLSPQAAVGNAMDTLNLEALRQKAA